MTLKGLWKVGVRTVTRHGTTIFTVASVVGVFATAAFAIEATPKAMLRITELEDRFRDSDTVGEADPTKMDYIKAVLPVYLPTIGMGLVTTGSIIGGHLLHNKQNALLAALYSGSEIALKEYQDKVIEEFGSKKEQKVRDAIAEDRMNSVDIDEHAIPKTGHGDTLMFDSYNGRYFYGDINKLKEAQNDMNFDLINHTMWASGNEFYDLLNLDHTDVGEYMGFDCDHPVSLDISSHMSRWGKPACVFSYRMRPRENYKF